VSRNEEEHGKNSARESTNEHLILNAKPVSPEILAAAIREPTVKFCPSSAIPATTVNVAAIVESASWPLIILVIMTSTI
jgi:hypothetical protein